MNSAAHSAGGTEALIELAGALADAARAVILPFYTSGLAFEDKADQSPVTQADRDAEAAMRRLIGAHAPAHGIIGEEYGTENADAEFVWVLDPIDGTKAFITGRPLFGTLIALFYQGRPLIGVMDTPALDQRWIGAPGQPSTCNGEALKTRACPDLSRAWLLTTSPQMHEGLNFGRFETLRHACLHAVYGGDCHAYGTLCRGRADVVCESSMQVYDYAALVPIVEGAGGRISDWQGQPLSLMSDGTVLAAGDPSAHEKAVALLA